MSTLLVNQINPVSGNTLTLSGSNIIIPGNLTITGNLSGSLTGSVESSSYALTSSYALDATNASSATSSSYALTASYALNSPGGGGTTDTGSLLLTASVDSNVITFTKGDASTFNITIDTGSASSIDTGSFATTGSNQFSGSQGITGSITIADSDLSLAMNQNFIVFENLNSPNDVGIITRVGSTYSEGGNTQAFLFPSSPTGGYKTITLPNDTGTVALTYNTATTGSNTFRGDQTISGSTLISGSIIISSSNTIFGSDNNSQLTDSYAVFQTPDLTQTYYTSVGITKISGSNSLSIEYPNLSGSPKTITFPDSTGTVALTNNTATTGSNTFTGNQIVNANLTLTSSATMSILTTGGNSGVQITKDQILINPNINSDRVNLNGGNLQLSAANGYSGLYLTNRNGSSNTSSIEIHRMQFYGKDTDTYNGLKAGLRVYQSTGTGSLGSFNFYTSASSAFGFSTGDLDMRISSGSSIELFRNTTISGSLNNGIGNTASGLNSHAEGAGTQAIGETSHAEGDSTAANGDFSHAEGMSTISQGLGSHVEGNSTISSGSFSHAEGYLTISIGEASHAEGLGTYALGNYQHVEGAYNITSPNASAYIIGNGTSDGSRSNLVYASGSQFQVTGSVSITSVLTLSPNDPLPTEQPTGSIAVSGSGVDCKPYFYNGTDWTSMI